MKKLLLFFSIFVLLQNGFATHNKAGDISYRCIGTVSSPYLYEITVKTYTKWTSTVSTDRCELILHYGDGDTTFIPRVNGVSVNCPTATDGVLIGGCSGNTRYNVYQTTHNYVGPGNYIISVEDPNRSSGLCNLPDSENSSFYLQAEFIISPFLGNNSGPVYNTVPILCDQVGVITYYNPMAIDSDGDSLYYELVPPMGNGASILTWTYPHHSNSFSIDNTTGIVTWDAPAMICSYVFDIKTTEWRSFAGNYYYIGSTMQEVWSEVGAFANVSENNTSTSVSVFPNPSNGLINFNIDNGLQDQKYQLIISNSLGQIIKTIAINSNSAIINEDDLSAGIYFYSLTIKNQVLNQGKFVILADKMK